MNPQELLSRYGNDPFKILIETKGYYKCQRDQQGKRIGPLVAYAGTYSDIHGTKRQFVGDEFANFAKVEQYPILVFHLMKQLVSKMRCAPLFPVSIDCFAGPQFGGISAATFCALISEKRCIYIQKQELHEATTELREQSRLVIRRHDIYTDENVVIIEDVLHNFSTTHDAIEVIENKGARVVGIGGFLNRSLTKSDRYNYHGRMIPVVALIEKPMQEWKQEDTAVLDDIKKGNFVLKSKEVWDTLVK